MPYEYIELKGQIRGHGSMPFQRNANAPYFRYKYGQHKARYCEKAQDSGSAQAPHPEPSADIFERMTILMVKYVFKSRHYAPDMKNNANGNQHDAPSYRSGYDCHCIATVLLVKVGWKRTFRAYS